jgi:hypothetical protein
LGAPLKKRAPLRFPCHLYLGLTGCVAADRGWIGSARGSKVPKLSGFRYIRGNREATILGGEVQTMNAKVILEGIVFAVVVVTAVALLPDFIRYMKIRSM